MAAAAVEGWMPGGHQNFASAASLAPCEIGLRRDRGAHPNQQSGTDRYAVSPD
jgi:hypothetical protein